MMPFPNEEVTPPVTNIYLAVDMKPEPKNFGRKGSLFDSFTNPGISIYFVFDEIIDMFDATYTYFKRLQFILHPYTDID